MIKSFFKSKFVFAIFLLLTLLLFAILGYKYVSDLSWINAIYMAIITISFVGFEELDASSESKIFVIILVISSAIILGYSIKIITEYIVSLYSEKIKDKKSYYSKRFAAKEAFVKAIGTGFRNNLNFKDISIVNDKLGKPSFIINEKIKRLPSKIIGKVETILIDECSMIRSDVLDGIDQSLKLNRRNEEIFGGVQIILLGDIYQLPPVVRDNEQEIFNNFYPQGHYFFNSNCYQSSYIKTFELEKVYRQKDKIFLNILNKIRLGNITNDDLLIINERIINDYSEIPDETIILSPTNRKVDNINNLNLQNILLPLLPRQRLYLHLL